MSARTIPLATTSMADVLVSLGTMGHTATRSVIPQLSVKLLAQRPVHVNMGHVLQQVAVPVCLDIRESTVQSLVPCQSGVLVVRRHAPATAAIVTPALESASAKWASMVTTVRLSVPLVTMEMAVPQNVPVRMEESVTMTTRGMLSVIVRILDIMVFSVVREIVHTTSIMWRAPVLVVCVSGTRRKAAIHTLVCANACLGIKVSNVKENAPCHSTAEIAARCVNAPMATVTRLRGRVKPVTLATRVRGVTSLVSVVNGVKVV